MPKPCPTCGGASSKVIYLGLPGHLCEDEDCMTFFGLAAYAPIVTTETWDGPQFMFMRYDGSYWHALWHWLTDSGGEA